MPSEQQVALSTLQGAFNNGLDPRLIKEFDSEELIINILKLATIPLRKYAPVQHMVDGGEIALSHLHIRRPLNLSGIFLLDLPLGTCQFLIDSEQVTWLDNSRIDTDSTVLGFVGMGENGGHGTPDVSNSGRAEGAEAPIVDSSFLIRDVEAKEARGETYHVD